MKRRFIMLFIGGALLLANPASAQTPPAGQEPGPEAERFREDAARKKAEFEKRKKAPEVVIEEEKAKPAEKGLEFTLKEVAITGATLIKVKDLKVTYQKYLGTKVGTKELDDITDKINAAYAAKGYPTSMAYIPKQDIIEGRLTIDVIEGKMGELNVEGNKNFSESYIKKQFHLKKNEPLNIVKLQRDILRLNQNSDLEIKTVITAGKEPGTSDVTLKATDKFPWHIGGGADNQGTRLVGKYRGFASVRSSNLTGNGDSLYVNTSLSSGSNGESVSYSLPITTYGTKAAFDFTNFYMRLGEEFKSYDIIGNTQMYTPHISQELYLSELTSVYADTGLKIKSIKKETLGNPTSDDQLRLPYFNFTFSNYDAFFGGGQTTFVPQFTFGTDGFLGASKHNHGKASRPGADGFFLKYDQYLARIQRMLFESYMTIKSQFQAASVGLPSSEQLQLGGANSVRGYPEGDYLCDTGATLNIDWAFPCYLLPKELKLPNSTVPLRNQIELVVFMDLAGGVLKRVLPGEDSSKFLMGIGGGLRIRLYNKVYCRLDWAVDVGDDPVSGSGPSTFYLTFQSEI